jgi:hypothetical protein
LLVNPASATYGRSWEIGDEYVISLNESHSNMVKFPENDRDGYEKVHGVLQDFIRHAHTVVQKRIQSSAGKP